MDFNDGLNDFFMSVFEKAGLNDFFIDNSLFRDGLNVCLTDIMDSSAKP